MPMHYGRKSRESEPHALPNVEVFRCERGWRWQDTKTGETTDPLDIRDGRDGKYSGRYEPLDAGWYWWACFPGCLPDSDPCGPFATEAEALADARESEGLCPHGCEDDEECEECDARKTVTREELRDALRGMLTWAFGAAVVDAFLRGDVHPQHDTGTCYACRARALLARLDAERAERRKAARDENL